MTAFATVACGFAAIASGAAAEDATVSGGSRYWSDSHTGGIQPGTAAPKRSGARTARRGVPMITVIKISDPALFGNADRLKLRYRIRYRARTVRVRVVVRTADGRFVRTIKLGRRRTGSVRTESLTRERLGAHAAGEYKLRLNAVGGRGRGRAATRAARVPVWLKFTVSEYRFPVDGPFSWGGADSRFGAGRPDHTHQGQDLSAAEGTPVIAPFGGSISWVRYQAEGAGWYVVLDADDGRDYVFMHLKSGSITVKIGDRVASGRILGQVGSTGASSGPHLHFEIWADGPWQFGGRPIDPRPLLESWHAPAPGGARTAGTGAGV